MSYKLRITNYGMRVMNVRTRINKPQPYPPLRCRAFTLVELMVVVVILGVLATIVTVSVNDYFIKGKQSAAKAEIAQISNALELFFTEHDRYPDNDEGLGLLTKPSPQHPQGILKGDVLDPWNNAYLYVHPGAHAAFEVCSYGANKQPGGTRGDTDICNYDTQKTP